MAIYLTIRDNKIVADVFSRETLETQRTVEIDTEEDLLKLMREEDLMEVSLSSSMFEPEEYTDDEHVILNAYLITDRV